MTLQKFDSKEMISLIKSAYIPLLEDFISRKISIEQFDSCFIKLFMTEKPGCGYNTFDVLETIRGDLECYEPDSDPQRWPIELGEQELYKNCQENLAKLKQIVEQA